MTWFPLHALTSASRLIVVHPCFIACDNSLQKSLFTILLKNLHADFHTFHLCASVNCFHTHLAHILWYPEVFMDDGVCRSMLMSSFQAMSVRTFEPIWTPFFVYYSFFPLIVW
jgi:hypothetical protein